METILRATYGDDCYACAVTHCGTTDVNLNPVTNAANVPVDLVTSGAGSQSCDVLTGNAAVGTAKSVLCLDTLACLTQTKCLALGSVSACYCGTASGTNCLSAGNPNGVCRTQEEAGLEFTDPSSIATNFTATNKGLAAASANLLVQCIYESTTAYVDADCESCATKF